jgi:Galactose binding lectin domain
MSPLFLFFSLATTNDYCIEEKLEIQCATDEIVVIETARYGRMRLNRCVRTDYGYIGCGTDVTAILAGRCSGRRHCHVVNLEALFASSIVCPPDLKSYLEASYSCVKGTASTQVVYVIN